MKANSIRRLDGQGRVILPSHIRKTLNLATDSAVTIDMTEDGAVLIRPAEERCSICGKELTGIPRVTIAAHGEEKEICKDCAKKIKEANIA